MNGKMPPAEEIIAIENAIDTLLTAIMDHERQMPPQPLRVYSMAELMFEAPTTQKQAAISWIVDDPVGGACRKAIRLLGERLYEITGSTEVMLEVAERAADREPGQWGRRIDIIDKRWDGIGNWIA